MTNRAIYELWIRLGYGPRLASLLTRLTTLAGHLPQGAPTSDALANHVLAPVDAGLIAIVTALDLKLSRYLDNTYPEGALVRPSRSSLLYSVSTGTPFGTRRRSTQGLEPRAS